MIGPPRRRRNLIIRQIIGSHTACEKIVDKALKKRPIRELVVGVLVWSDAAFQ